MIGAPTLALPRLAPSIPFAYEIPGENGLLAPLALALLEAGLVDDRLLSKRQGGKALIEILGQPDERELCILALTDWWSGMQREHGLNLFHWKLVAQEWGSEKETGSFDLVVKGPLPQFSLARAVGTLEALRVGFGQTVLALLRDALRVLPTTYGPWDAFDSAHWIHWGWTDSDEEYLEKERLENGYETIEQLLAECSVMTRVEFHASLPEWVAQPQRVLTRRQIVRAARDEHARAVVAACDDLAAAASQPGFLDVAWDNVGVGHVGLMSQQPALILHWSNRGDMVGSMIDDHLQQVFQSGEDTDLCDICQFDVSPTGLAEYGARMRHMLRVAGAVEALLLLIGDPV